jgi:hypothetical protein
MFLAFLVASNGDVSNRRAGNERAHVPRDRQGNVSLSSGVHELRSRRLFTRSTDRVCGMVLEACSSHSYCDLATLQCAPKTNDGSTCTINLSCMTGYCELTGGDSVPSSPSLGGGPTAIQGTCVTKPLISRAACSGNLGA